MNRNHFTTLLIQLVLLAVLASSPAAETGSIEAIGTMGKGALYQVAIAAQEDKLNYLEACIRAYPGKNKAPLMLSSGLEDHFLGTCYFDTGKFHTDMAGLTHFDRKAGRFSAYRFPDEDPVVFRIGLRLTCRCGETEHGAADGKAYLNPTKTRYTTYTWVYQW